MPITPADKSITSLFIGGVTDDSIREKDLISIFSKYGEIKNVKILLKNYCCFVTFATRDGAENAMTNLFNKLMIKGQKYKLMWGRVQNDNKKDEENELLEAKIEKNAIQYQTECPLFDPSNYNPESETKKVVHPVPMNIFDVNSKPYYPSMDPNALGGLLKKNKTKNKDLLSKKEDTDIKNKIEEIKEN